MYETEAKYAYWDREHKRLGICLSVYAMCCILYAIFVSLDQIYMPTFIGLTIIQIYFESRKDRLRVSGPAAQRLLHMEMRRVIVKDTPVIPRGEGEGDGEAEVIVSSLA